MVAPSIGRTGVVQVSQQCHESSVFRADPLRTHRWTDREGQVRRQSVHDGSKASGQCHQLAFHDGDIASSMGN